MQKRNFTQIQLAEAADTSQSNISRYLRNEGMPRAEELHRMSVALGVSMEWLLTGDAAPLQGSGNSTSNKVPSNQARKALRDARAALDRLESELDSSS